jgi:hypothetical protein
MRALAGSEPAWKGSFWHIGEPGDGQTGLLSARKRKLAAPLRPVGL